MEKKLRLNFKEELATVGFGQKLLDAKTYVHERTFLFWNESTRPNFFLLLCNIKINRYKPVHKFRDM